MMKKLISLMTVLCLLLGLGCCAEEDNMLYPYFDVDMATFDLTDSTVHVTTDSDRIDENLCISLDIYAPDLYDYADLIALKPGDRIFANNEEFTIATIEYDAEFNAFEINGGFIDGDGVSLWAMSDNPTVYYSFMYDDSISYTLQGQAVLKLAENVIVSTYVMDEEGEPREENEVNTVRAEDLKDYILERELGGIEFFYDITTVRVVKEEVTEITVNWAPNC